MIISELNYFELISRLNNSGDYINGVSTINIVSTEAFAFVDDSEIPSSSIEAIAVGAETAAGVDSSGFSLSGSGSTAFLKLFPL